MKDRFSRQAEAYAQFRPRYPARLIAALAALAPQRQLAWDCGTGNGQCALLLAQHFQQVIATDISARQIAQATPTPNVEYRLEPAEASSLPERQTDLIIVAQAIHWFDFERFCAEAQRVLRPEGVLAVLGYGLFQTDDPQLDQSIGRFYHETIGPYWDPERHYIDEEYRTIPFPFEEVAMPAHEMAFQWALPDLLGYLSTWSAVQRYIAQEGENPLLALARELERGWSSAANIRIRFPLLLRVGRA
jgi:SAM-dependent methyltransferase